MSDIYLHFEDIATFSLQNSVIPWLTGVVHQEHYELHELNYIFCSDDYLLDINQHYLDHDYYTDVITFDHSSDKGQLFGDIFISVDRVRENAADRSLSFEQELHRVMVHGVLHLCGYQDKHLSKKKIMTSKEDAYLSLLP